MLARDSLRERRIFAEAFETNNVGDSDSTRLDNPQSSERDLSNSTFNHRSLEYQKIFSKKSHDSELKNEELGVGRSLEQLGPSANFTSFGNYNFAKKENNSELAKLKKSQEVNYLSGDSHLID